MTYTSSRLFTFEEFLTQYGDNSRYELIDGELRDMASKSKQDCSCFYGVK